jgi:hypothetical protein
MTPSGIPDASLIDIFGHHYYRIVLFCVDLRYFTGTFYRYKIGSHDHGELMYVPTVRIL